MWLLIQAQCGTRRRCYNEGAWMGRGCEGWPRGCISMPCMFGRGVTRQMCGRWRCALRFRILG
jgi:hypothetical protein